jgi:hypothetical protein
MSDLLPRHRDRWMEGLKHLVDSFHTKDFVHGDSKILSAKEMMILAQPALSTFPHQSKSN